jgi:hypothetical protein
MTRSRSGVHPAFATPQRPHLVSILAPGVGAGPKPLSRQRSPWRQDHAGTELLGEALGLGATCFRRQVHDGTLSAVVGEERAGWHMSVSHAFAGSKPGSRYPTWDELTHARYSLLPAELDFVMHLPPESEYVAAHPTAFHLHEHPGRIPWAS